MTTIADVQKMIDAEGVEMIDVKFTDLFGQWHHFSLPAGAYDEGDFFEDGLGFDGSSIRGFQTIEVSDMVLLCDPSTAVVDPITAHKTLSIVANVADPITKEKYSRGPRNVAERALAHLKDTGIADSYFVGPEAEFFVFDQVSYATGPNFSQYMVDSGEAHWNSGNPGMGHQSGPKGGYFPVAPFDTLQDLRTEMVKTMMAAGLDIEVHHHEVATAGQCEIDMRFAPMLEMADAVQMYKYIVKNVAKKAGKSATFLPKPIFQDNGSGMHTHMSLWKDGEPLFAGDEYAGLSKMALHYIGGILKHINSLLAFAAPTTNSYRRLVPGYEAPVVIAYSARNRSAACRIPTYSNSPKAKRVEFRCPDPTANPYLAFSAMLMAGLDGIKNEIDPGEAAEKDLFAADNLAEVPMVEGSLYGVLDALKEDNAYLLEGGVFTQDLLDAYLEYKLAEADEVRLRPHPHELVLYYGI